MEDCSRWEELPVELQEKVFAWLPLECVGRFCSVSKEWKTILSSTRFIKTIWSQTPLNRNPWLVAFRRRLDDVGVCASYNFITKTWENRFFFASLHERASAIPGAKYAEFECRSSALGLCIVDLTTRGSNYEDLDTEENIFCNPLTRTFLKLPTMSGWQGSICIVRGEGDSYKIVAFREGRDGEHMKVFIYDPSEDTWKNAGQLSQNNLGLLFYESKMVSSENSVYCLVGRDPNFSVLGIVGFNIEDGTSIVIPLPNIGIDTSIVVPKFFSCGGRLLLVGCVPIPVQVEVQEGRDVEVGVEDGSEVEDEDDMRSKMIHEREQVVIWELQENMLRSSNSSPWREIARMPSLILAKLKKRCHRPWYEHWTFKCVGAGDYVVFFRRPIGWCYNLSDQKWRKVKMDEDYFGLFAFEPRPDMKVP